MIDELKQKKEKRIAAMMRKLEQFRESPIASYDGIDIDDRRLPPGQSWVRKGFPVLDLGEHPEVPEEEWTLVLEGCGLSNTVTLDHLMDMNQSQMIVDIHCVTAWSVPDAHWHGVSTRVLLGHIALDESITHAMVHGYDGYSTNLSLSDLFDQDAMFAYGLNGAPLSVSHGGPVRLVIPHLYFWKSPKWISRIEFMSEDQPGFWEQRGYHNRGNPWREERVGEKIIKPHVTAKPEVIEIEPVENHQPAISKISLQNRLISYFKYIFRDSVRRS